MSMDLKKDVMDAIKEAELLTRCKETEKINTKRFVKCFYEFKMTTLVNTINKYATKNNLKIISLSTNENLCKAIVLFEGE